MAKILVSQIYWKTFAIRIRIVTTVRNVQVLVHIYAYI